MQKTDARTLREIERLFERYKIELRDSPSGATQRGITKPERTTSSVGSRAPTPLARACDE